MKQNIFWNKTFVFVALFALVVGSYAPATMPVRFAYAEDAPSADPLPPPPPPPETSTTGTQNVSGPEGGAGTAGETSATLPEGETFDDPSDADGSSADASGSAEATGDGTTTSSEGSGSGDGSGETEEGGAEATAGADANASASEEGADADAQGGNSGDGGSGGGGGVIVSGDAAAAVNLVNVVNTTIIGSEGLMQFLNIFAPLFGTVDTREWGVPNGEAGCIGCADPLSVNTANSASLFNNLGVSGETGENTVAIGDLNADGGIFTGMANAAANVLNIVNTNLVGSNYLLLVMNNFNSWGGDLVLPGKDFFTTIRESVLSGTTMNVQNQNAADVENNLNVQAGTGENAVEGTDGTIMTGDANAAANAVTVANQNMIGNAPVFILIRYFGTWTGNIFSPPEGITWKETPGGIMLYDTNAESIFSGADGAACCDGDLSVENQNEATIRNNVNVIALTGANKITGGTGGVIQTGNANAAANVVNIVNTNIVGRNWVLAIINIFGNWTGNLAFGRPDLWVAEQVELSQNPVLPQTSFVRTIDVMNHGDADATQVVVEAETIPEGRVSVLDADGGTKTDRGVRWVIPRLAAGESKTFTYVTRTADVLPAGPGVMASQVSIKSFEPDQDMSDNSDSLSIPFWGDTGVGLFQRIAYFGRGLGTGSTPNIKVTKTHNAKRALAPGDLVQYTVTVENTGMGAVWNAALTDVIHDPEGKPLQTNKWDLDIVYPMEKIVIKYDNRFGDDAASGWYVNRARFTGRDFFRDEVEKSASAGVEIRRQGEPETPSPVEQEEQDGEVLGAATCGPLLSTYLYPGLPNHRDEVMRLQDFLNRIENAGIPLTGMYGPLTLEAVKKFQAKYAKDILEPWKNGDDESIDPSGYVYLTTQRFINMMNCSALDIPMPDVHRTLY